MMGVQSLLLFLGTAFLMLHTLHAGLSWNFAGRALADIPNPNLDPAACGRAGVPKSSICDPDLMLSKNEKDEIEGHINKIPNAQVAVAIIDKMNFKGLQTSDSKIASERFARGLHDMWGVGSTEKNDGILVFVSITDRLVYISTGTGVQHIISYDATQALIQHMRPLLRKERYGTALANCMIHIELLMSGKAGSVLQGATSANSASASESATEFGLGVFFFVAFLAIGYIVQYRSNSRTRRYQRGREMINKLMHAVDPKKSGDAQQTNYFTSSCPICLEDFPVADDYDKEKKPTAKDAAKLPMALGCGHIFCRSCLETYLRSPEGCKCPICRAPVEDVPPPAPESTARRMWRAAFSRPVTQPESTLRPVGTSSVSSSSFSSFSSQTRSGTATVTETMSIDPHDPQYRHFHSHTPEIRFRLHRMRTLYPDLLSLEMFRAMNGAIDRGALHEFHGQLDARQMELQRTLDDIRRASELQARNNGMGGASSSFGGGHSGGGGGSSW